MAQTWPVTKRRIAALKFVDSVGRIIAWPFRKRGRDRRPIESVLIVEPWHIGDVVLVTPMLRQLRDRLPNAKITLLAQPVARDLLQESGLVDEIISARLPWTAPVHKYRITPAVAKELGSLIKRLRKERFDVSIDARMDIRSNFLTWASGARVRVGYGIGGGGWLLNASVPADRNESHKIDDWLTLLSCLDLPESATVEEPRSMLTISGKERADAERTLAEVAGKESPTIGYHPGGSHPGKRWPAANFRELIVKLRESLGGRHIVFLGPDDEIWRLDGVAVLRSSLREFMAQVSRCDVLVCNDSGPMHIADALGVPVVAIFEVGNPQWYGPSGPRSVVVSGDQAGIGMSAAPLDQPPQNPVSVERVAAAVRKLLGVRR